MSPFQRTSQKFSDRIENLTTTAQVAFFASAARILIASYRAWLSENHPGLNSETLVKGVEAARAYALGANDAVEPDLLAVAEPGMFSNSASSRWFTGAQDCWICADTAIKTVMGPFAAADMVWYVLEPMFEATSMKLFGVTDVGSVREEEGESAALKDPALAAALASIGDALTLLERNAVDVEILKSLDTMLMPISPS